MSAALSLRFLPANSAWAFCFGDSLLRLEDASGSFPMFYSERAVALWAASACGLRVLDSGAVETVEEGK